MLNLNNSILISFVVFIIVFVCCYVMTMKNVKKKKNKKIDIVPILITSLFFSVISYYVLSTIETGECIDNDHKNNLLNNLLNIQSNSAFNKVAKIPEISDVLFDLKL